MSSIVFTFIFPAQWVGILGWCLKNLRIPVYTAQKSMWKCLEQLEFTVIDKGNA